MELREERIDMYMAMLADYGFELDPETAYSVASCVVDGDIEWHDIWETKNEEDRDIDEKPIGFIVTTETENAYGLLAAYIRPEYRGTLRAINAIVRLIRDSDPKKCWMYQVRSDGARARHVLTNAMVAAGYKAVPAPTTIVKEWDTTFSVYKWVKCPPKPAPVIERKSKDELQETFSKIVKKIEGDEIDDDMANEPDFDVVEVDFPTKKATVVKEEPVKVEAEPATRERDPEGFGSEFAADNLKAEEAPESTDKAEPAVKPEDDLSTFVMPSFFAKTASQFIGEETAAGEKPADTEPVKEEPVKEETEPEETAPVNEESPVEEPGKASEPLDDFDLLAQEFTAIEPETPAETETPAEPEAVAAEEPVEAEPVQAAEEEAEQDVEFPADPEEVGTPTGIEGLTAMDIDDEIDEAFKMFDDIKLFADELDARAATEVADKEAKDAVRTETEAEPVTETEEPAAPEAEEEAAEAEAAPAEEQETAEEPEEEEVDFQALRVEADALTKEEDEKKERIRKMREDFDREWADFLEGVRINNSETRARLNAR